jgi:hypothetical protein
MRSDVLGCCHGECDLTSWVFPSNDLCCQIQKTLILNGSFASFFVFGLGMVGTIVVVIVIRLNENADMSNAGDHCEELLKFR